MSSSHDAMCRFNPNPNPNKGTTTKLVMNKSKPSLSIFDEVRYCAGEHKMIHASKGKCKYCQYLNWY